VLWMLGEANAPQGSGFPAKGTQGALSALRSIRWEETSRRSFIGARSPQQSRDKIERFKLTLSSPKKHAHESELS
jgi:hypothetical protein